MLSYDLLRQRNADFRPLVPARKLQGNQVINANFDSFLAEESIDIFALQGMYGYAQDINLIQDGQLSEVRMHGEQNLLS